MADYQSYGAYQGGDDKAPVYTAQSYSVDQSQNVNVNSNPPMQYNVTATAQKAREPKILFRLLGILFSFICFCCAAAIPWIGTNAAFSSFLVFVAVIAFLFNIFILVTYFVGERLPVIISSKLPLVELLVGALWTLFWFAAATAYAVNAKSTFTTGPESTINGAITFAYFAFIACVGDVVLAFKRFRESAPVTSLPYSSV